MPNYYVVICCTWFSLPEEIHQPEAGDSTWPDLTSTTQSNNQTPQCLPKTPWVPWCPESKWLLPSPCLVHSLAIEKMGIYLRIYQLFFWLCLSSGCPCFSVPQHFIITSTYQNGHPCQFSESSVSRPSSLSGPPTINEIVALLTIHHLKTDTGGVSFSGGIPVTTD